MKMKINSLLVCALSAMLLAGTACSSSDNSSEPTSAAYTWGTDGGNISCDHLLFNEDGTENANGTVIGNGTQDFVFKGNQTIKKGTYVLKGWIYIADGSTLTIEPGTIIKGDKQTKAAIIAERGGKLIAKGSATEPIVFTSNQAAGSRRPGDWGGIILCGKAPNNQNNDQQIEGGPRTHHGGTDAADNSGILSYVRIEFAGYPFATDQEINGLTFGSVGSGTQIDHVQVSYSNDDSFEWFGGTVNCKYLIAYKGWDDDFDTDNGFSGHVQFGLGIRDPRIADQSQSNGFESDNCADGALVEPYTKAVFSNITFVGPVGRDNFVNNSTYINGGSLYPNNGSGLGKFQTAMQIRRSSRLSCFNSLAVGYPIGIIVDGEKGNTVEQSKTGGFQLQNVWFANMTVTGSDANKVYDDVLYDATKKAVIDANQVSYSHTFFLAQPGCGVKDLSSLMLTDNLNTGANYMPQAGSPLLSAASFTAALLNGFDAVSYIGACSAGDTWLNGWTNFDPENTKY
ncbi:MAG: hypothetical protein LKF31_03245 [Muribaculaceae bacterium]|jgi:hypothetical protein|nr:hypothetical protein [Muribaculaceae bacterium]